MIGLSKGDIDQNFGDIDYAIYLVNPASFRIYESGVNLGTIGSYAAGDEFAIEVDGSDVLYKFNGQTVYTSTDEINANSYPLLIDTSLHTTSAVLENVFLSESFQEIIPLHLPTKLAEWSSVSNICIEGQRLEKIAGTETWDAGTSSKQIISNGTCFVETKIIENTHARMLGLNKGDANYTNNIDFAISLHSNNDFCIYENGIEIGTFGQYQIGDIIRVEIIDDAVFYRVNEEIRFARFEVIDSASYPLRATVAMKSIGAMFENIRIGSETFPPTQSLVY